MRSLSFWLGPALLPYALVACAALFPLLLWRAVRRRERREARERFATLVETLGAFVNGDSAPAAVRRAVRAVEPGVFWQALEHVPLDRRARRRLGHLLERSRPAAIERRALREETTPRREVAAWRLGHLDCPSTRRALRRALAATREPVVAASLLSLARAGDASALRFVLARPRSIARRTARFRFALFRAFGPRALPLLHDAVEADATDPQIVRAAIETLGAGAFRPAAPSIARRLHDPEPDVRVAAARALGQLGTVDHTISLKRALGDAHWAVRAQSAKALGRLRAYHCERDLVERLTDSSWWVRRHAAYALAELGQPGLDALENVVRTSPDRYAREMAQEVLDGGWLSESA